MSARRLVAILLIALAGCSGGGEAPRAPVYGRVTLRGWPLKSGAVTFTPDRQQGSQGPTARVDLTADGRFIVPSGGLPAGFYRLTVASLEVPLPVRLRDPDLANIVREVKAGHNNIFEIELEEQLVGRRN